MRRGREAVAYRITSLSAVLARLSVDRLARAPARVDPKLEAQGQGYRSQTKYTGLGYFSGVVV